MEFIYALDQIRVAAKALLVQKPAKVILFHGEMGAGKTTFIKALSQELGVKNATSSPTFSLVNEYETGNGEIVYHFDMYRLKNEMEALDMGIEDYLYSGHWCFIEWAENIPNLIPDPHAAVTLTVLSDGKRKLVLTSKNL